MKKGFTITIVPSLIRLNHFRGVCAFILGACCFGQGTVCGQEAKKNSANVPIEDPRIAINRQDVIGRLFGIVNELKSESDKPGAALLQAEVADVLWRFDEPAARSLFRLAFDTVRQASPSNSSTDAKAKSEAASQSRRRASAIRTILKRYGIHDRKSAEAWLQEFETEIKAERAAAQSSNKMSQEQAELLAEVAVGLVSQDPTEAQRLGLLSLSTEQIPSAFSRLLMALRGQNKVLSDVLFRQAVLAMRIKGFKYDPALLSLTNYEFFSDGRPLPDVSPNDAGLMIQYFIDAASTQAARLRSGNIRGGDEQGAMGLFYSFLTNRATPIVARNSPETLPLLESNVGELALGLTLEQRQQAEMLASLNVQKSALLDGNDSDIESLIHRAEQEKNTSTRNLLLRNLALRLMRRDPRQALAVAQKIDEAEVRAQTEDDVYLVLLQESFRGGSYDEAKRLALKINDLTRRARWLAEIASQLSSRSKDHTGATDLLYEACAVAAKSDNSPAKLETLLFVAKEFVLIDQERGFDILSDAIKTANKLETRADPKTNGSSLAVIKVITITVLNGKEVSTDDTATVDSIDFKEISVFAERDYLETSLLGADLKNHFLRAKYFIALARSILHVPRQGLGYERSLEDILSP